MSSKKAFTLKVRATMLLFCNFQRFTSRFNAFYLDMFSVHSISLKAFKLLYWVLSLCLTFYPSYITTFDWFSIIGLTICIDTSNNFVSKELLAINCIIHIIINIASAQCHYNDIICVHMNKQVKCLPDLIPLISFIKGCPISIHGVRQMFLQRLLRIFYRFSPWFKACSPLFPTINLKILNFNC